MAGKIVKIAISGQARTGKNTLAEMIVALLNPGKIYDPSSFRVVAVADPIKNMVMQMVPDARPECLWGQSELRSEIMPGNLVDFEGNSLTYRRALIDIGTLGRKYNNDIWLNALVKDSDKHKESGAYIVSDVRFPNEINYLKEHGFYMIRLKRLDAPRISDESETVQLQIPDLFFDDVIENNKSLIELNDCACKIVNKFESIWSLYGT